ncbi:hypothetical protein [Paenibacillus chitinolyticus]|uniref:hypothetical protein n=1 Tax=Paenibacillus chitinolyticus TaxID=79263 RepID=UPI001C456E84|nr:hypothetical protein [Paenibacillus chitinolyticus]MBV6715893.1 hypothetical protein [Paenibacillus chitinolyticus]
MIAITEKIVSPINEAASANRCSLIRLIIDDATSAQLLAVARRHCKLALEHGKAITTAVRRREIIEEIQSLRSLRGGLIDELRKSQNNGGERDLCQRSA